MLNPGRLIRSAAAPLALFDPSRVGDWIAHGGPFVIFGLLFACGLGFPLPEDVPLIIGGIFAGQGKMNLVVVGVLAWCGIIGGDCVLYHMGKRYGLNITRVPFVGKHLTQARIVKAERLFDRYGVWVVAVGRLFAGIRGAMVVAAGTIRFSFIKFLIADGLAALVSGGLFVWLGYFLGRKFDDIDDVIKTIDRYKPWVIGGIAVAAVLAIIFLWWRSTRKETVAEVVAEEVIELSEPPRPSSPDAAPDRSSPAAK